METGSGTMCAMPVSCARLPEEPGAVIPHAGIREGGTGRPVPLPQSATNMNTKTLLAITLLFFPALSTHAADESIVKSAFVDDAPAGFVHIGTDVSHGDNKKIVTDDYVVSSKITNVSVTNDVDREELEWELLVYTNQGTSGGRAYEIGFKKKEDAEKTARRIMEIKRQAEQPGAAQPATKPADKAPVKDQPPTQASKDGSR
jgi:hypothetical protein